MIRLLLLYFKANFKKIKTFLQSLLFLDLSLGLIINCQEKFLFSAVSRGNILNSLFSSVFMVWETIF